MNIALIVAAGRGHRLGGPTPKQYLPLGGVPILRRTILAFQRHPDITAIQVLIHPNDQALYDAATEGLNLRPALPGGATRQDSVRLGLQGIADLAARPHLAQVNVLIHDAVRPFIAQSIISDVIEALGRVPAALVCVPVVDTLKRVEAGMVTGTIDRAQIFRAQTPQGFHYHEILKAHRQALRDAPEREFTDDSSIAEHAGLAVEMVPGSEENFKITTDQDLYRAEYLLNQKGPEHEL